MDTGLGSSAAGSGSVEIEVGVKLLFTLVAKGVVTGIFVIDVCGATVGAEFEQPTITIDNKVTNNDRSDMLKLYLLNELTLLSERQRAI